MGSLNLPFQASQESDGPLFEIICTGGAGVGVAGSSYGTDQFGSTGVGVWGESDIGQGVSGQSQSAEGVRGASQSGPGVFGSSSTGLGVLGNSDASDGVFGQSFSVQHAGVSAVNDSGGPTAFGVWARGSPAGHFETNSDGDALYATTSSPNHAGVSANNTSQGNGSVPSGFALWASANATAIYAQGNPAAYFNGNVLVTGDLSVPGADIAEDFDTDEEYGRLEPGTVLVINEQGKVCASDRPYDTRVAGVISGAGDLKPGVILNAASAPSSRVCIALVGRVFCKADATSESIVAGDLLTTACTPGYAMKASDKFRATGAIVGKALRSLGSGAGLIPILVCLR